MHIINVSSKGRSAVSPLVADMLAERLHVEVHNIDSSALSAFSSMRIAAALKKFPAEFVFVTSVKDATAAMSARKISAPGLASFKIVLFVDNRTPVPLGIALEVLRSIDLWIFSDADTASRWSSVRDIDSRRFVVIPPTTDLPLPESQTPRVPHSPLSVTWVGPLVNITRLEDLLRRCALLPRDTYCLNVYGTGKARYVMPMLDRAQLLTDLSVKWHGEYSDLQKIVAASDLHYPAEPFLQPINVMMLGNGIPFFSEENFRLALSDYTALSTRAFRSFNTAYSPCFHVEQLAQVLASNRP